MKKDFMLISNGLSVIFERMEFRKEYGLMCLFFHGKMIANFFHDEKKLQFDYKLDDDSLVFKLVDII